MKLERPWPWLVSKDHFFLRLCGESWLRCVRYAPRDWRLPRRMGGSKEIIDQVAPRSYRWTGNTGLASRLAFVRVAKRSFKTGPHSACSLFKVSTKSEMSFFTSASVLSSTILLSTLSFVLTNGITICKFSIFFASIALKVSIKALCP